MSINLTTILTSAITAAINGIAIFLATRYTAKIVDKFERNNKNDDKH